MDDWDLDELNGFTDEAPQEAADEVSDTLKGPYALNGPYGEWEC